jgi:lipoprotein-anchoring transpeptidase ErfK/SrfK
MEINMSLSRRDLMSSLMAAGLVPGIMHGLVQRAAAEAFPIDAREGKQVEYKYQRRDMEFATAEPAGSIVVNPKKCFLYFVLGNGMATRYGCSVGKSAKAWTGEVIIKKMKEWPVWIPAPYHIEHRPTLAKWVPDGMPGGPDNPMGARALYLYKGEVDTINRIHGAMKPGDIGKKATAGCIGMLNVDIVDLYARVQVGTRVVMLG